MVVDEPQGFPSSMREFIAPVRRLAEQAEHVHVVFNNNLRDQGIRGATIFSGLLGLERGLPHTEE